MNSRTPESPSRPADTRPGELEPGVEATERSREQQRTLGKVTLATSEAAPSSADTSETPLTPEEEEQAYAEQILSDIARWRGHYDTAERDFIRYAKRVQPSTPEGMERYDARLLRAEHDAEFAWRQLQHSTRDAVSEHVISSTPYDVAYAQRYGEGINPGDTIEASTAKFYRERIQALNTAVRADDTISDEARRERIELLGGTWNVVYAYIEATYRPSGRADSSYEIWQAEDRQRERNSRHNDMIKHLNHLNDLAREYQVMPLTFRNFMANDATIGYQARRDRGNALWHKAEYDREVVANYFRKVFSKDISAEEAALARRMQREQGDFWKFLAS